jgi:hypothetical protein
MISSSTDRVSSPLHRRLRRSPAQDDTTLRRADGVFGRKPLIQHALTVSDVALQDRSRSKKEDQHLPKTDPHLLKRDPHLKKEIRISQKQIRIS